MVDRFKIEEGLREGGPGSFAVVEGDDEDGVGVGKGAVPDVVVGWGADGEDAAVDGEEGGEESRGGEVVVGGEEDAVLLVDACMLGGWAGNAHLPHRKASPNWIRLNDVWPARWRIVCVPQATVKLYRDVESLYHTD